MKTKHVLPLLCASALIAFTLPAFADDGGDGGCTNECDIQGTEVFEGYVVLSATTNAPTNATGVAKIDSDNEDGDESASIDIRTANLDPGDYSVSVTLQSTGSNVFVGDITVISNQCCGGDDQGDDDGGDQQDSLSFSDGGQWNWQCGGFTNCYAFTNNLTFTNCFSNWNNWCGFTNWGCWSNSACGDGGGDNQGDDNSGGDDQGCGSNQPTTISHDRFDLPAGVNPTDIGVITVSDTNGNAFLVGNLTNPAPATVINVQATVQLTPGTDGSMNGSVQLQSTAEKGKWKHNFNLQASGAAAHSTYKMKVNGKTSGAGKSTKSGQLAIKKLPPHVSALRSLKLLDAKGNEAASAHF